MRCRWVELIACLGVFWLASPVHGSDSNCLNLLRKKLLPEAAACFEKMGQRLRQAKSARQRLMRGRVLRNAATLYQRAAASTTRPGQAAYLRSRAALLLRQYLKDRLYELQDRKKSATLMLYRLERAVGYAHLTVVADDKEATLTIKGFRFLAKGKGVWSQRVRPGQYQLKAHVGSSLAPPRQLLVKPGSSPVVRFSLQSARPKARATFFPPKRRPLGLALLGAGAGLAVLSAVLFGVAEALDHEKVQLNLALYERVFVTGETGDAITQDQQKVQDLRAQTGALFPLAWITLSAGLLSVAAAGTLAFWPTTTNQPPSIPPSSNKTLLLQRGFD